MSKRTMIRRKDRCIAAMKVAGYEQVECYYCILFAHEDGLTRMEFDTWYDVEEWLRDVVFDDPKVSDAVESILNGKVVA